MDFKLYTDEHDDPEEPDFGDDTTTTPSDIPEDEKE